MSRAAAVGAEHSGVVEGAAQRFGDHESMSESRVLKWMLQFEDEDLALAAKVLEHLRYFNANNIRNMTRQMVEMVVGETGATRGRSLFVPMTARPGGGSETVARALREVSQPFKPRLSTMVDLLDPPRSVETVVFVDDFSGTGNTLVDWWENVETLVRPLAATVVFAALVMTSDAADRARELGVTVAVEEMGAEANALHEGQAVFTASERATILNYCRKTGCSPSFMRGYGDSGLLVAFRHGCPNNSLPVLWYGGEAWAPLFHRRAL